MTSNHGKILAIVFFAVISAGGIFFGLQHLSSWHEEEIQSALELQRRHFEIRQSQMELELRDLEEQLDERTQRTALPEARISEVFGNPGDEPNEIDTCELKKQRIDSFFKYIDKKTKNPEMNSHDVFLTMMGDLAEKPPLVVGETRDLITLLRNRAHFFRVLKKDRIDMVRGILRTEKDVLESAMADFYAYYIGEDSCEDVYREQIMPITAMYDYAGFFLESISGKSYLMRRDSTTRSLSLYYSVLILDQSIDKDLNNYGIDIRGHIDLAMDDIQHQSGLAYQDHYLETLEALEHKYQ